MWCLGNVWAAFVIGGYKNHPNLMTVCLHCKDIPPSVGWPFTTLKKAFHSPNTWARLALHDDMKKEASFSLFTFPWSSLTFMPPTPYYDPSVDMFFQISRTQSPTSLPRTCPTFTQATMQILSSPHSFPFNGKIASLIWLTELVFPKLLSFVTPSHFLHCTWTTCIVI